MKNKVEDLRDHLFATLEALQDEEKPMEIGRAKAIAQIAQVIVNSAKAETEYLQLFDEERRGTGGSGFMEKREPLVPGTALRLAAKGQ